MTPEFSAIELPTLFLAGTRDRLVRTRRAALEILNPRTEWIALDAPHLVLQTAPDAAANAIRSILARIGAAPR